MLTNVDADEFGHPVVVCERENGHVFYAVVLPGSCPLARLWMRLYHAQLLHTLDDKILGDKKDVIDATTDSFVSPTSYESVLDDTEANKFCHPVSVSEREHRDVFCAVVLPGSCLLAHLPVYNRDHPRKQP